MLRPTARSRRSDRPPGRGVASWVRAGALATALAGAGLLGCGLFREPPPPLEVADSVDLGSYLGTWYEIARFEGMPFQEGCAGTTADYGSREDGRIQVVNRCVRDGELSEVSGVARKADEDGSAAKLEVSFFWPFWGDYWILAVDEDRYALVGAPSRDVLWILSREPSLDVSTYRRLVATAAARGFDVSRLQRTAQPPTLGPHAP
jgi:apolipoprotein D and lipocalin family protein